jgi:hypothetical protein
MARRQFAFIVRPTAGAASQGSCDRWLPTVRILRVAHFVPRRKPRCLHSYLRQAFLGNAWSSAPVIFGVRLSMWLMHYQDEA